MDAVDLAREAALVGGRILSAAAVDGPRRVDFKGATDLVTEVDRASEDAIRAFLARHTPEVPVLGEETGGRVTDTCWIVDPLDGTTNFVHGFPFFSVSVALRVDGVIAAGAVHAPLAERTWTASRGGGAFVDGRRLAVSAVERLDHALVCTGFSTDPAIRCGPALALLGRVLPACRAFRRTGSAAIDLALVAEGRLDAFWELALKPWDVAAGVLFVEEAGGRVCAVDGGPLDLAAPDPLATNAHLQAAMLACLRGEAPGR